MSLERYALGQENSEDTFCRWMEFRTQHLGSMRGGSARKLLIYKHKDRPGWYFDPEYGDEQSAWLKVREAFVQAFVKAQAGDWDMITNSMFAGPDTALLALARYLGSTSPSNRMGYASEQMDALLSEALATPYDDLPPVMAQINDQLNTDFTMASYGTNGYVLVSRDISGIIPSYAMVNLFFAASLDG